VYTVNDAQNKTHQITAFPSPAWQAGLHGPVFITAINGVAPQGRFMEPLSWVKKIIHAHPEQPLTLELKADLKKNPYSLNITPSAQGRIGVSLDPVESFRAPRTFYEPFTGALAFLKSNIQLQFEMMGHMFLGNISTQELSGPIGIVTQGAQVIDYQGIQAGLRIAAVISAILAVMNFLPIPPLDGGHLIYVSYELLFRKPMPKAFQDGITNVGLLGLMALMVFIIGNDLNNNIIRHLFP
jgi:regulator of sigma E protease